LARGIFISAFLAILFIVFYFLFLLLRVSGLGIYFSLARNFVFTPSGVVRQLDDRTNILILGKAGEGYTAPDLTDTMIVASVGQTEPKMTFVSLPRDIWVEDLRAKLNSVYYWGNKKEDGGGLVLAKSVVEEIIGVPIHYAVVVDLNGLRELIDQVGGIEVNVERTFTDNEFPIPGKEDDQCGGDPEYKCRYETIQFEKGLQFMNGETALKFVRSRHSEDLEEGTDLARASRQQLVLAALQNKVLSSRFLLNINNLKSFSGLLNKYIETDMSPDQEAYMARKIYDSRDDISSYVLPEELLENPPISDKYDNLYVFVPFAGNWSDVQKWILGVLP